MKHIKPALLILLTLAAAACNKPAIWKYQEVKGLFKLELPDYMSPDTSLHEEAALQYDNIFRNVYCVVLSEEKQPFIDSGYVLADLKGYNEFVINRYKSAQQVKILKTKNISINGSKAILNDLSVNIKDDANNENVFSMQYVTVEGKRAFYQMMVWTTEKDKARYANDANRIIGSLKELP